MIVGYDAGNYESKVVTPQGAFKFLSCLGEWREFNMDIGALGEDDIVFEYEGNKGFAGTLAKNESFFIREMAGESKAHEDALIRILIGLHRFTNDLEHDLIVGQPIKKHKAEKEKIISMLKKRHSITVNGITKTFVIRNIAVAPEGAGAFWAYRGNEEKVRIIDVGSGTVNGATVNNGKFVDRESFTLNVGANTEENLQLDKLAGMIIAKSTKKQWHKDDCIKVCGGVSEKMIIYLSNYFSNVQLLQPMIRFGNSSMKIVHPVFANAVGFYELARDLYGG